MQDEFDSLFDRLSLEPAGFPSPSCDCAMTVSAAHCNGVIEVSAAHYLQMPFTSHSICLPLYLVFCS